MASPPLLYTGYLGTARILAFPTNGTGNISPTVNITGASTGLSTNPLGTAIDSSGNLWVSNLSGNKISQFAAGVTGNVTPLVNISGASTTLNGPRGIAFDSGGNLWVANYSASSVLQFSASQLVSGGNIVPNITISGASTNLTNPADLAVDVSGNIYVEDDTNLRIYIFAANSSGNVAPSSIIGGSNSGITVFCGGVALDTSANVYWCDLSNNAIRIWNAGVVGNVAPSSVISGGSTGLSSPRSVVVDPTGIIYVINDATPFGITYYSAGSSGNASPIATIAGANTLFTGANQGFYLALWNSVLSNQNLFVFNNTVDGY